jgi:hypothetical protein
MTRWSWWELESVVLMIISGVLMVETAVTILEVMVFVTTVMVMVKIYHHGQQGGHITGQGITTMAV